MSSLRRNTLWNLAGNGLPLLAGAVAIPQLLRRLGTEQFGIVTLIWTVIGYLSLFDFGLGRALTQLTAQNVTASRGGDNLLLLRTAVYLTAFAGGIGAIGIIAFAHPLAYRWLSVSPMHQKAAFQALVLTAMVVPVTTVTACFRGALEGHEHFRQVNFARVFLGISTFLFPALAVTIGPATLTSVVLSLAASRLITLLIFLKYVRAVHPDYRLTLRPHHAHRRQLLTFGSWMTVSNVISPILVNADRFIISGALGASMVAYYTVPFEIIIRLQIIPGALGSSLFPRLAGATDEPAARQLVKQSTYLTGAVLGACCSVLVAVYLPVVSLWIGSPMAHGSFSIAAILAGGAIINGIAFIIYTAVQARTGAKATGILHSVELLIYVPLLLLFVHWLGIVGAAWAWSLRATLDCALLCAIYFHRPARPADHPVSKIQTETT